jgi:hypothetical protein
MSIAVEVTDSAVIIRNLTLDDPNVIQYFKRLPEEERTRAAIRTLEIGVFCVQRVQMGHGLDFVRLEVQRLIQSAENAISNFPTLVEQKLGGETGTLAPIRTAVSGAQSAIHQKLNEVGSLFSQHLDPANAEATLGRALSALRDLINPERSDSVQQRIESAISSIAQSDGALVATVRREVDNATTPLREAVNALTVAYAGKKGAEEALADTTEKGFDFESELLPFLRNWASVMGAEFEYVGPQNLPGDFVIRLQDTGAGPCSLTLVIEARDRKDSQGRTRIAEHLNDALKRWNGNYGIYVSKTKAGLANEIGEWLEFSCGAGPVITCTSEHLNTALRFAVVMHRLKELQEFRREVDLTSVVNQIGRFRTALNHLKQIKSKVTEIRNLLPDIETEADSMRAEIDATLQDIETVLPK